MMSFAAHSHRSTPATTGWPRTARRGVSAASALAGLLLLAQSSLAAPQELSLQEAASKVGRSVFVANGSAGPTGLVNAMRDHALRREGRTNVYHLATMLGGDHFTPEVTDKWHPHFFFVGGANRAAATAALNGDPSRGTLHRKSLYTLGQEINAGKHRFDTAVVTVSPPDKNGMVSLGTAGDLTLLAVRQVLKNGGRVIAEVNPFMPHTAGNRIPYDKLAVVTKGEYMLPEYSEVWPSPVEVSIGRNVAGLLRPGKPYTLQVGIGNALGGLGQGLSERHTQGGLKLRIRSEMGTDSWLLPMLKPEMTVLPDHPAGKPTRRQQMQALGQRLRGKLSRLLRGTRAVKQPGSMMQGTAKLSFLHGTANLYDACSNNPKVKMGCSVELNDPKAFAAQVNPVAVNTALEVDLLGNVNAERVVKPDGSTRIISFPGGQPDFMKGASLARSGKAILALRSTVKGGPVSTIVPAIKAKRDGKPMVTTPKSQVDHIVTEWGATRRLRGLSDRRRALEVLKVAHPLLRQDLAQQALKSGLISKRDVRRVRRSIYHTLEHASPALRGDLAQQALDKRLISSSQHQRLMRN